MTLLNVPWNVLYIGDDWQLPLLLGKEKYAVEVIAYEQLPDVLDGVGSLLAWDVVAIWIETHFLAMDLIREIRRWSTVPILLVGNGEGEVVVDALVNGGADRVVSRQASATVQMREFFALMRRTYGSVLAP